jgi:enterochelin esterase-like enzyme
MRRLTLLILTLVLVPTGCSHWFGDADNPADDTVTDFSGRDGRYTRTVFRSDARGWAYFSVYLPPGWAPEGTETYPLIFFLHGQGGDERTFPLMIRAREMNEWIESGEVPPFVLIAPRGADVRRTVQWYHRANERMLTSEEAGELRAYAREMFRAGVEEGTVSLHGHSRGASGALFMAMNHPEEFASIVANAFVSDYVLSDRKRDASRNRDLVLESGVPIRMVIGTKDRYAVDMNRSASPEFHQHLQELGIPHEYEVFEGVSHGLRSIWNFRRPDGMKNGLYELQFHARAWERASPSGSK